MTDPALTYREPGITRVLEIVLFLLSLNLINHILNKWIYCGLIGQILIGTAVGTPGANLLGIETERTILQLGYIGLILLVYEGGLSSSLATFKKNAILSIVVALTGISLPIGITFVLLKLCSASPLQAFAAGAALCSTSLGTTFTVLESTGLTSSRLGTILMNAAMLDDIVGLVMIRIISVLGETDSVNAITILRPIIVSISLVAFLLLTCRFLLLPFRKHWLNRTEGENSRVLKSVPKSNYHPFLFQSALLTALVSGGSYAGTSSLFAAYLAGSLVSWWDEENCRRHERASGGVVELQASRPEQEAVAGVPLSEQDRSKTPCHRRQTEGNFNPNLEGNITQFPNVTGKDVYAEFYQEPVDRLLKPFFFASIGFCIPISAMFHPPILWRGLLYALLMILAKLATGLWVVSLPSKDASASNPGFLPRQTHHLVPPLILGCAMVARGEIGFLIAGLAEGTGVFTAETGISGSVASNKPPQIYLVVIWAIVICTIFGPMTVGYLVRRVNRRPIDRERETM